MVKHTKLIYGVGTAAVLLLAYGAGRISNNQQTYSVNIAHQNSNNDNTNVETKAPKTKKGKPKYKFYKTGLPAFKPETYKGLTFSTTDLQKAYVELNNPDLSGKNLAKILYIAQTQSCNIHQAYKTFRKE